MARSSVPGSVHHIMSRDIEGQAIFGDDSDRRVFLDLVASGIQRTGYLCYAWVLMNKHYQLGNARQWAAIKLAGLSGQVCKLFGVEHAELTRRGRGNTRSDCRKMLAALAHRSYGIPLTDVADFLHVAHPSASAILDAGEAFVRERWPISE